MDDTTLLRMLRQIADFYQPYSDEEAADGIATHLKNFWEPRMRTAILALYAKTPDQFEPRLRAGLDRLSQPADGSA